MKPLPLLHLALGSLICVLNGVGASLTPSFFAPVVPKNLSTTLEGAGASDIPFGTFPLPDFHQCESCRFQQVISASEFSELPQEKLYIYSVLMRGDTCNRDSTTLIGAVMRLSTTSKQPDNLSMKFAENIGPDERVVLQGRLGVGGGGDCMGGAARFDVWYILSNSFAYSPSKGNLLIDLEYTKKTVPFDGLGATMDAQTELGDGISMIYGCPNTAEVAKEALTTGLVFQFFIVSPVLRVDDQGDSILLRWSTHLPTFRLQASDSFDQESPWKDYGTGGWLHDSETIYATLKKSELGNARYFRLYSDSPTSP